MGKPDWVTPPTEEELPGTKLHDAHASYAGSHTHAKADYLGLHTSYHDGHFVEEKSGEPCPYDHTEDGLGLGHVHHDPPPSAKSICRAAATGDAQHLKVQLRRTPEWHELVRSDEHANGSTALHHAATKSAECTQLLVDAGCDIDAADLSGCTPLHYSARADRPETLGVLLDAGADTEIKGGFEVRRCPRPCPPFAAPAC